VDLNPLRNRVVQCEEEPELSPLPPSMGLINYWSGGGVTTSSTTPASAALGRLSDPYSSFTDPDPAFQNEHGSRSVSKALFYQYRNNLVKTFLFNFLIIFRNKKIYFSFIIKKYKRNFLESIC